VIINALGHNIAVSVEKHGVWIDENLDAWIWF
jgi:hypothetical protein